MSDIKNIQIRKTQIGISFRNVENRFLIRRKTKQPDLLMESSLQISLSLMQSDPHLVSNIYTNRYYSSIPLCYLFSTLLACGSNGHLEKVITSVTSPRRMIPLLQWFKIPWLLRETGKNFFEIAFIFHALLTLCTFW